MRCGIRMNQVGAALLTLLLSAATRAEETPAFRDLTLSVHARQALANDDALREFNLAVQVKKGVAELRGRVPTADLAKKAAKLVGDVQGILGVRDYLEVRPESREPAKLVLEVEPPSSTRAAVPLRDPFPEIPLNVPAAPPAVVPEPQAKPPAPAVVLQPPTFSPEPTRPRPQPEVLVSRPGPAPKQPGLDAVLADPAYQGLKVERKGKVVHIHQRSGQAAAVMALARRLSDLPDVEEIVLVPEGR